MSATTTRKPTPRSKDRHFTTRGAAFVVSMPAAREESSGIRAIAGRAVAVALRIVIRQPRYLSCMSTPPPVALTAMPCCVEETRTITPA